MKWEGGSCKPEKLASLYRPEKRQGPSKDSIRVSHTTSLRGKEGDLPKWDQVTRL